MYILIIYLTISRIGNIYEIHDRFLQYYMEKNNLQAYFSKFYQLFYGVIQFVKNINFIEGGK